MRSRYRKLPLTGLACLTFFALPTDAQTTKRHSATIKWAAQKLGKKASENERIAHYLVYRAEGVKNTDGTTTCEPPYQKIAQVDAPTTAYTDATVLGGQVYCYKVTAVRAGIESATSAQSVAVIPGEKDSK